MLVHEGGAQISRVPTGPRTVSTVGIAPSPGSATPARPAYPAGTATPVGPSMAQQALPPLPSFPGQRTDRPLPLPEETMTDTALTPSTDQVLDELHEWLARRSGTPT